MARKLKTYQTSQGFYDLAVAAPSMKAALQAWGMHSNLFHQGFAWFSDDARVVDATLKKPGVTLRRPVGSKGAFVEHPGLPKSLPALAPSKGRVPQPKSKKVRATGKKKQPKTISKKEEARQRTAAEAFQKAERKRQREETAKEAARAKERSRRERAIGRVQAKLDEAEHDHNMRIAAIEKEQAAIDKRAESEDTRWERLKNALTTELKRAKEG